MTPGERELRHRILMIERRLLTLGITPESTGALTGIGTIQNPLAVQVDNSTIIINAQNELEAVGGGSGGLPDLHAVTHQNGGTDEITVAGLSGVLADPQTVDTAAAGALDGDGSAGSPLAVRVDGITIIIVGNQLVATGSGSPGGSPSGTESMIAIADGDESINNDTIQNDDELSLPLAANTVYLLEAVLMFTTGTSTTPDAKFGFTYPAGATVTLNRFTLITTATTAAEVNWGTRYQETTPSTALALGVISTANIPVSPVVVWGIVRVGATPGTLMLQWAQNTSTAGTPTIRKADSYIKLTPT